MRGEKPTPVDVPIALEGLGNPPLRLLYLPNEEVVGHQAGPREAFEALLDEGRIAAYEAFPFLHRAARSSPGAALDELLAIGRAFKPDIVLWQHVSTFPVDQAYLARLRSELGDPTLVYHEGDVYGRLIKRLPAPVRAFAASADLVSLVGLGSLAEMFRHCGARRIVLSPHSYDSRRFGQDWSVTMDRPLDVLMIGNRVTSRLPFIAMPGARERVALAEELSCRFGARFAVFGANWGPRPYARGPIPFDQQLACIRSAWVTASWDHFHNVPYYFSDRLPIALAAGVPHVTNRQPGYENFFPRDAGLAHAQDVMGVADAVTELLSKPRKELTRLGASARQFASQRLSARRVYTDLLEVAADLHVRRRHR